MDKGAWWATVHSIAYKQLSLRPTVFQTLCPALLCLYHIYSWNSFTRQIFKTILQKKKLRHREVEELSQGHTVKKWTRM